MAQEKLPQKVPVHNNTKVTLWVGGTMIPPGETRHFNLDQVPAHLRPQPAPAPVEPPPADPMAELLEKPVKDIVEMFPALSLEEIQHLGELEQQKGDEARKTLLSAIAEELLERGSQE